MAHPSPGVIDLHDRDRRARQTYNDHVTVISRYAALKAGPSDGPDLVQEAFQILFAYDGWLDGRLDHGQHGHRRVAGFLRTTVDNRYKMLVRSAERRRRRDLLAFRRNGSPTAHHDRIPSVDDATVAHYLRSLRSKEAEAVRLHLVGLSSNEIATEMNIKPDSARKNLRRGLAKLADLVGNGGTDNNAGDDAEDHQP